MEILKLVLLKSTTAKLPDAIAAILSFNTLFKHQRASIAIGSSSIIMQITFGSVTLSPSILIPVIALKAKLLQSHPKAVQLLTLFSGLHFASE